MGNKTNDPGPDERRRRESGVFEALAKLEGGIANLVESAKQTRTESAAAELAAELLRGIAMAGVAQLEVATKFWKRKSRPESGAAEEELQPPKS